jgi:hypothetical protein
VVRKVLRLNNLYKILGLLACLLPLSVSAQDSFRFEASTNTKQVALNSYFEVTFTLKNASGTDFAPPSFEGFSVLAGPSTSTSMQIINGVVSREMAYSYTLQPKKAGKFTIGSASIRANGKKLTSNTLSIDVIKSSSSNLGKEDASGEVFVRLEMNKAEGFIGEQLLLDYKLYTSVSIDGYDIQEEPDYRGFYAQELKRFDSSPMREEINGKQYTTKILRRIALFPQQAGKLNIGPARLQLAIVEENDRTGFFFNRSIRPVFFTTNSLEINVKALPPGAPESFSGAVGEYDFQAAVNRNQVSTDDALTLTLLITGNGDVKRIQPPALSLSDSFEVYAPKVVEELLTESQGEITGKKTIEYLALPKYPGEYSISPSFSYLSTLENKYVTIDAGPFRVKVLQGSDRHAVLPSNATENRSANEIRFIKTQTTLERNETAFVLSPGFWGMAAFPVVAFIGVFFFRKMQDQKNNVDFTFLKSKLAKKEAQKRLSAAHAFYQSGNSRAFYDEISKASLGYICDKLTIPLSQLSKDNVRVQLESLGVSSALVEDFMGIIQACEMALFAGMDNASDMQTTYEKAMTVIAGIEAEIGQLA